MKLTSKNSAHWTITPGLMGSTGSQQLSTVAMARQAGLAVAKGALLAGPLAKRSEWLHSWNIRFAVLTTEALLWQRELSGSSMERRALLLDSMTRLSVRNDSLLLQPSDGTTLWFRAASAAELSAWQQQLSMLLATLQTSARVVRLWMREHSAIIAGPPLAELPHAGSRNARARALHKARDAPPRHSRARPPRHCNCQLRLHGQRRSLRCPNTDAVSPRSALWIRSSSISPAHPAKSATRAVACCCSR